MDQSEEKRQLFQDMLEKARQIPHAENKRAAELEWRAAAVAFLSYGHVSGRQSPAPMQQLLIDVVNELVPVEANQAASGRAWS